MAPEKLAKLEEEVDRWISEGILVPWKQGKKWSIKKVTENKFVKDQSD